MADLVATQLVNEITLGSEIRRWREYRGLGLRELARLCSISAPHLLRVEADERIPGPKVTKRIERSLRLVDGYFYECIRDSLYRKWKAS